MSSQTVGVIESLCQVVLVDLGFPQFKFCLHWLAEDKIASLTILAHCFPKSSSGKETIYQFKSDQDTVSKIYDGAESFVWPGGGSNPSADPFFKCIAPPNLKFGGSIPFAPQLSPLHSSLCVFSDAESRNVFETQFLDNEDTLRLIAGAIFLKVQIIGELNTVRDLSEAESRVFSYLSSGLRAREIAARLGKAERTVQNQIESARQKLGARNTTEAIAIWMNKWMALYRNYETVDVE